jgi:hypothetical protein
LQFFFFFFFRFCFHSPLNVQLFLLQELRHPVTGQFNATYPYRISLGALRSAGSLSCILCKKNHLHGLFSLLLTLLCADHAQRCLFAELNIPVEFSPSQGQFNNRGASVKCGPAVWNGPDAPQDPYAASPFQWGDSQCSSNDVWTNETTGRFVGIAKGFESSVYNWLVGYSDVHPKVSPFELPLGYFLFVLQKFVSRLVFLDLMGWISHACPKTVIWTFAHSWRESWARTRPPSL